MTTALIDGDILLYRAGFATQKTLINELGEKYIVAEPVSHSCSILDHMIRSILITTEAYEYRLYIGSGVTFRHEIAKTLPYKGNRTAPKPVNFVEMKDYLVSSWGALEIRGIESDDQIGIDSNTLAGECVICSIDKDLLMLPGTHYNFVTGCFKEVVDPGFLELQVKPLKLTGGGIKWFWAQMLLGDRVDNIPGLTGYGPRKTYEVLNKSKNLQKTVNELYFKQGKEKCLDEIGNLLWIQRKENDKFTDWVGDKL